MMQHRELTSTRRCRQAAVRCVCRARVAGFVLVLAGAACTETFNAGKSRPDGKLPVDERNPMILVNDSNNENWQGEYALLLANGGGLNLVGIIVGTSPNAKDIDANVMEWRALIDAANKSRMRVIPELTPSTAAPRLVRPASGNIDENVGINSEGASLIVKRSKDLSLPYRPLVVLTGGRLTDVANAYFMDPTVADRVVVVSALGSATASGGTMGPPNGEMDPWADTIVTSKFRYVQVSAYYDQLTDVPATSLSALPPNNAFADWIRDKQSRIWADPLAADQVAVAAVAIPEFVKTVERVSLAAPTAAGATTGPDLTLNPKGPLWLVTEIDAGSATKRFWELLRDPATFAATH